MITSEASMDQVLELAFDDELEADDASMRVIKTLWIGGLALAAAGA
jgi:hypothetical protein